jgi:hypothetical protein
MGFGKIEEQIVSNDSKYTKGVYIEKARIIEAVNMPTQEWCDCNMFVRCADLEKTGQDGEPFKYAFYLSGKHEKDRGSITGWGKIGKVDGGNPSENIARMLTVIGCDLNAYQTINEDGSFSDELLADMLTRKIAMIRYESSGQYPKTIHTWKFGHPDDENVDADLRFYFDTKLEKGQPKDYAYLNRSTVQTSKLNNMLENVGPSQTSSIDGVEKLDFLK